MTYAAADALCGLPRIYERTPLLPGYVAYVCPVCEHWHQCWESKTLRRLLAQFPDMRMREG